MGPHLCPSRTFLAPENSINLQTYIHMENYKKVFTVYTILPIYGLYDNTVLKMKYIMKKYSEGHSQWIRKSI